jgi:hypothetical protein
MDIQIEDSDIMIASADSMMIAKILPPLIVGDMAIHPIVMDMSTIDPTVTFRGKPVAKIDIMSIDPARYAISAKITFGKSRLSKSVYRLFVGGILWSFVIHVDITEVSQVKEGDDRFPLRCKTYSRAGSIRSLAIDPYAPI